MVFSLEFVDSVVTETWTLTQLNPSPTDGGSGGVTHSTLLSLIHVMEVHGVPPIVTLMAPLAGNVSPNPAPSTINLVPPLLQKRQRKEGKKKLTNNSDNLSQLENNNGKQQLKTNYSKMR